MKEYLLVFRGGLDFHTATAEQIEKAMQKWRAWIDEMTQKGIYGGGQRLTANGAVLKGQQKQLIDGPYAESKELVGGYIVIKAPDLPQAIDISKECPIYDYNGSTEIREIALT